MNYLKLLKDLQIDKNIDKKIRKNKYINRLASSGDSPSSSQFHSYGHEKNENTKKASELVVEPAAPNARAVYWENADGSFGGPMVPIFLARYGERSYVVVDDQGENRWILSDMLRARPEKKASACCERNTG